MCEAIVLVILWYSCFSRTGARHSFHLLAVPVSLIGTFAIFPIFGFSINTLSLFGLILAIGLVVDDAIVVVEAVEHHIEHGLSPKDATFKAMEEVTAPGDRNRLDSFRSVRPDGCHGRHQGSAQPTIRNYHCRFQC